MHDVAVGFVWQDIDIGDLIEHAGVFFHYGSTSLADTYLAHIPAVYVHSRETACRNWFPDMGWPSARSVAPDEIPEAVRNFRAGRIVYDGSDPRICEVLEFNFNIRAGEPYLPSHWIAEFLLQEHPFQRIAAFDRYKWRSLCRFDYYRLRRIVGRPIRNALRAAAARVQR